MGVYRLMEALDGLYSLLKVCGRARAPVMHITAILSEKSAAKRNTLERQARKIFIIAGPAKALFDTSRAPEGKHGGRTCRVPNETTQNMTEAINQR